MSAKPTTTAQMDAHLAMIPDRVQRAWFEREINEQLAVTRAVVDDFFATVALLDRFPTLRGVGQEARHQMAIRVGFFKLMNEQPLVSHGDFLRLLVTVGVVQSDATDYRDVLTKELERLLQEAA